MKINDILPMKGHVLVTLPESITAIGDLVISDTQSNDAPVRGEIIRIPEEGSVFAVGDLIYFRKYAIDDLKFKDDSLNEVVVNIVDEKEILGVYSPVPEVKAEIVELSAAETIALSADSDQLIKDSI